MSARKTVIVLAGTAGSGKDTSGCILARLAAGRCMAYADPLKDAVHALVGIPKEILYGTQHDKETYLAYDKSARHWLQWVGTEVARRQIHKDLWVHRFADRALACSESVVICTDGRFKNEIECLREALVGKARVYSVRVRNPRVAVNLTHQSESEIYNLPDAFFDHVLNNDGTLAELESKLMHLAQLMGLSVQPSLPL